MMFNIVRLIALSWIKNFLPFIGHSDGGVDTTAKTNIIQRIDDLWEDEDVDDATLRDWPGPN